MKATGVVRKIDHLGRIVIPKEIRKTLKIREGENLEIYVENDAVILKKASSMAGLDKIAEDFTEIIANLTGKDIMVTDSERVIATNKEIKKDYFHQELESSYFEILEKREVFVANNPAKIMVTSKFLEEVYYMLVPIVIQGELLGSFFLYSKDEPILDSDKTIVTFASKFLEKSLAE